MFRTLCIGAALAGLAVTAATAQDQDLGKEEFMVACAGCHGETAMGDGPLAGLLKVHTPNLTKLAERNGGTFPFEYAVWVIDGRQKIPVHGATMPVWGERFMAAIALSDAAGESLEARELIVRGRILSLVYYLESIQQ